MGAPATPQRTGLVALPSPRCSWRAGFLFPSFSFVYVSSVWRTSSPFLFLLGQFLLHL